MDSTNFTKFFFFWVCFRIKESVDLVKTRFMIMANDLRIYINIDIYIIETRCQIEVTLKEIQKIIKLQVQRHVN